MSLRLNYTSKNFLKRLANAFAENPPLLVLKLRFVYQDKDTATMTSFHIEYYEF